MPEILHPDTSGFRMTNGRYVYHWLRYRGIRHDRIRPCPAGNRHQHKIPERCRPKLTGGIKLTNILGRPIPYMYGIISPRFFSQEKFAWILSVLVKGVQSVKILFGFPWRHAPDTERCHRISEVTGRCSCYFKQVTKKTVCWKKGK